jgi:hypothetical protein
MGAAMLPATDAPGHATDAPRPATDVPTRDRARVPTRDRILYASAELFRRQGYAGTGL